MNPRLRLVHAGATAPAPRSSFGARSMLAGRTGRTGLAGRTSLTGLAGLAGLVGLVGLVGLAGCVDYLAPDVGVQLTMPCRDEDYDPEATIDYQLDIQGPIFDGPCFRCHDPTAERPVGITRVNLDTSSYGTMRRGGVNTRKTMVIPGKPCKSMLYLKLLDGPPFGARMPGNAPPFLTEEDILKVHDWIAEGARE